MSEALVKQVFEVAVAFPGRLHDRSRWVMSRATFDELDAMERERRAALTTIPFAGFPDLPPADPATARLLDRPIRIDDEAELRLEVVG